MTTWTIRLLIVMAAALVGCQGLVGLEDRSVDPTLYADASLGAADAGSDHDDASAACALVGEGDSAFRLANAYPSDVALDACYRREGDAAWKALLASLPPGCPTGLSYLDVTVAVPTPAGSYDFRIIPAGAGCDATPIASATGVTLQTGRRHSIIVAQQHVGSPVVISRVEYTNRAGSGPRRIRFMNLLDSDACIDVGVTTGGGPHAAISTVIGPCLGFGETPSPSSDNPVGDVDPDGYLLMDNFGMSFGSAFAGETEAFAALTVLGTSSTLTETIFAVGRVGTQQYPPAMLECNENKGDGVLATCRSSLEATKLVASIFAAELVGAFSPYEEERRSQIPLAIAKLDADVICVTEVARQEDRDAIIAAAKSRFPYAVMGHEDRTTPFSDPTDASGHVPQAYTDPPCAPEPADPDLDAKVDAVAECLAAKCSSIPGSADGYATSIDCVTGECFVPILQVMGTQEDRRCMSCGQAGINMYMPINQWVSLCRSDVNAGWTFDGQSYQLILSAYPIEEGSVESFVFPSSLVRRSALRATIQVGAGVDFYCTNLGDLYQGIVVYPGLYGGGVTDASAWPNEQLLQANKLCSWVSDRSAGRRAIVAGLMNASKEFKDSDGHVTVADNAGAATQDVLEKCFAPGVAPDWVPACTECSVNPLVQGDPPGTATSQIYLHGLDRPAVISTEQFFADPVVEVPDGNGGTQQVPLSTSYGLRSTVSLE